MPDTARPIASLLALIGGHNFGAVVEQLVRDIVVSLGTGVPQAPTEAVLVSGVDVQLGGLIGVTLSAARVVGAPLNPYVGARLTFTFIQGGAGAWAVTWNAVFKKVWSDAGNATGARSSISFYYDGTNWNQDGAQATYV